jgi:hypothetical protein
MRAHSLMLTVASALALGLAPAAAHASDSTATAAYISADAAMVAAARAKLGSSEATLKTLLRQLKGECPNVAAESPQDEASEQLSNELVGTMTIVGFRPNAQAIASFTRAVKGLRWSSATLTGTVRSYARKLSAQSALTEPHLCADLRAWVGSGYRTLPASTRQFDQSFFALDVAIGLLPTRQLARYATTGEMALMRRTHQLELQLVDGEARAVAPWGQIMEVLALNP